MKIGSLVSALLIAGILAPSDAQTQNPCKALDYNLTTSTRNYIVGLVTASGTGAEKIRMSASLPAISPDSVSFVSDSTTCAAAALAHANVDTTASGPDVLPVWVLRVGATRYVVFNPERYLLGVRSLMVFDDQFIHKASLFSDM